MNSSRRTYHVSTYKTQQVDVVDNVVRVVVGAEKILGALSQHVDILHLQRRHGVDVQRHQVIYSSETGFHSPPCSFWGKSAMEGIPVLLCA